MNSEEIAKISDEILEAAHFKLLNKIELGNVKEFKRRLIEKIKVLEDQELVESQKCICIHFSDTGGFRIADMGCYVHGVNGTNPGDGYWSENE